jgi:hypothetical protein
VPQERREAELKAIEAALGVGRVRRLCPQRTPDRQQQRGRIQHSGHTYR